MRSLPTVSQYAASSTPSHDCVPFDAIFAPKGTQSWEGVELAAYWETVGKLLMTQRLYAKK